MGWVAHTPSLGDIYGQLKWTWIIAKLYLPGCYRVMLLAGPSAWFKWRRGTLISIVLWPISFESPQKSWGWRKAIPTPAVFSPMIWWWYLVPLRTGLNVLVGEFYVLQTYWPKALLCWFSKAACNLLHFFLCGLPGSRGRPRAAPEWWARGFSEWDRKTSG